MKNSKKAYKLKQYIIVISMFLTTGTFAIYMKNMGITSIIFFFETLLFLFTRNLKFKKTDGLNYLLWFISWEIFNYFIINTNHLSNNKDFILLIHIIFCFSTYLIISNFNIHSFKRIYLNISFILSILGLIAFLLGLLKIVPYTVFDRVKVCMYQNLGWASEDTPRLAGLFWEPGAFQIVLMICFILFWNDITNNNCDKRSSIKLIIILMAFVATQSSWGYFCLSYYILTIIISKINIRTNLFKLSLLFLVGFFSVYYILTSPIVKNKLAQAELVNTETSYSVRLNDNQALLKMIDENPFTGYGISTKEFERRSKSLDNKTSSNGLLQMGATLGLIMLSVFLIYTYKSAQRMFSKKVWLMFPLFLLIQMAEVFYYFPLSYILLFPFKSYSIKQLTDNE